MAYKHVAFGGTLVFIGSMTGLAKAQEPAVPAPAPAAPAPVAPAPAAQALAAPAPARATAETATAEGGPDHDLFIGHLGVTYFDITNLPIATLGAGGAGGAPAVAAGTVAAPVVGARYWLQRDLGIDAGIGLGWATASTSTNAGGNSTSADQPSPFGVAFHAGLPLAFAHGKHYSFLVIPETTLGFTSETVKNAGAPDTTLSGVLFDLGGRVGAEIHFGFIGVPELSLQASLGLFLAYNQTKAAQGNDSVSTSAWSFSSTVGPNPWAIFTNNISATLYL